MEVDRRLNEALERDGPLRSPLRRTFPLKVPKVPRAPCPRPSGRHLAAHDPHPLLVLRVRVLVLVLVLMLVLVLVRVGRPLEGGGSAFGV